LASLIQDHGHPCVRYVPRPELSDFLTRVARSGDTLYFLGAGDIGEVCHGLAERFHSTERAVS